MKKIITILILLVSIKGYGQQSALFAQYYAYPILINPGVSGFDDYQLIVNYRANWVGFPGAPKEYAISFDGSLDDRSGVGLMVFSEQIASLSTFRAQANYAYLFHAGHFKVGTGLSGAYLSQKLNSDVLSDLNTFQDDDILQGAIDGDKVFDMSFGVYARDDRGFFVGLALPNMISAHVDNNSKSKRYFKNYMGHIGYKRELHDYQVTIEPSVMVNSYDGEPIQLDFNLLTSILNERIYAGFSYRFGQARRGGLMAGLRWGYGTLMYSYGYSFQKLQNYSGAGHEVSLRFDLSNAFAKDDEIPVE